MENIILYGAGMIGKNLAIELTLHGIHIECFCDKNQEKCGKDYCGYPVRSIEEVRKYKRRYVIFVAVSKNIRDSVKKELIDNKVFPEANFYDEEKDSLKIMSLFRAVSQSLDASNIIPPEIINNFRSIDEKGEKKLKEGILNYFYNDLEGYTERGLSNHMYIRLEDDRKRIIPWLDSIHKLEGSSILEIGCGTGASTVALCEQKAQVTAIDVDNNALDAAKIRMHVYGLIADIKHLNATDIMKEFPGQYFDFIIFYASLEHMTFEERIQSLRAAFQMLKPGGNVVLVEIPNRLWYIDSHTSFEPFYNWLPDKVAMEYSRYTSREVFNHGFDAANEKDILNFSRWGMGVSYHEIEIALGGKNSFKVVSSLGSFLKLPESAYKRFLRMAGPQGIHEGFYEPYLYIAMHQ